MDFAFAAHSGTRYLVLLVGLVVVIYALFGLLTRRRFDRAALVILRVFGGVIDLQVVLGIATVVSRPFFGQLIGHIVMMIAAAAVAHVFTARIKKLPEAERRYGSMLTAGLVPLALIIGGILAIQRAIV